MPNPVTPAVTVDNAQLAAQGLLAVSATRDFKSLGRYSKLAEEAYKDAKRLTTLEEAECYRFSCGLAADWGRAMAQAQIEGKYGKQTKDGFTTLKEVASSGKNTVRETRFITLARIISAANDLNKLCAATAHVKVDISLDVDFSAE